MKKQKISESERWVRQSASLLGYIMGGLWLFFGLWNALGAESISRFFGAIIPGLTILLLTSLSAYHAQIGGWLLAAFGSMPLVIVLLGNDMPLPVLFLLSYPILLESFFFLYDHYHFKRR